MVRRLKEDIREIAGGFPKRKIVQVDITGLPPEAPELRLSRLLDTYRTMLQKRLSGETKQKQAAAGLLVTGLQQRLLSSVEAFASTLRIHRKTVQRLWEQSRHGKTPLQKVAPKRELDLLNQSIGSDDERAEFSEDELKAEEESQIEAAASAVISSGENASANELFAQEQKLLDEMTEIAEANRGRPDARVVTLIDWIRKNMCPGLPPSGAVLPPKTPPKWNDTRLLIFTEWVDSMRYLERQLSEAIAQTDLPQARIATFHGQTVSTRREEGDRQMIIPSTKEEIKRAFNTDPKKHPLRILLATDAARE